MEKEQVLSRMQHVLNLLPQAVHQARERIIGERRVKNPDKILSLYEDDKFCRLQKRRGSTEGRIGIFKNAYFSLPLRSKGFENRERRILWSILSHNPRKLSTIAIENQSRLAATAA